MVGPSSSVCRGQRRGGIGCAGFRAIEPVSPEWLDGFAFRALGASRRMVDRGLRDCPSHGACRFVAPRGRIARCCCGCQRTGPRLAVRVSASSRPPPRRPPGGEGCSRIRRLRPGGRSMRNGWTDHRPCSHGRSGHESHLLAGCDRSGASAAQPFRSPWQDTSHEQSYGGSRRCGHRRAVLGAQRGWRLGVASDRDGPDGPDGPGDASCGRSHSSGGHGGARCSSRVRRLGSTARDGFPGVRAVVGPAGGQPVVHCGGDRCYTWHGFGLLGPARRPEPLAAARSRRPQPAVSR